MSVDDEIVLYPGFPLTARDYDGLLDEIRQRMPTKAVTLAHSHGAVQALASRPQSAPMVLLAPSDPRRPRPGCRAQATALYACGCVPRLGEWLAGALRRRSFEALGLQPPVGPPLPLREAAQRLTPRPVAVASRPGMLVVTSPSDPRHEEQLQLAQDLAASVAVIEGGHMFPLTAHVQTARLIQEHLVEVAPRVDRGLCRVAGGVRGRCPRFHRRSLARAGGSR